MVKSESRSSLLAITSDNETLSANAVQELYHTYHLISHQTWKCWSPIVRYSSAFPVAIEGEEEKRMKNYQDDSILYLSSMTNS